MGDKTGIEWTDATWNPIRGCSRVSEGCRNCYAEKVAARFSGEGQPYEGLVTIGEKGARWNGTTRVVTEHLTDPLRWKRDRRVFVNSMSDLFHESVAFETIALLFGVMAAASQHTFQVLTKRPQRARDFFKWWARIVHGREPRRVAIDEAMAWLRPEGSVRSAFVRATREALPWPLANVWLGVSVEDQRTADERIPVLLELPAALRFVSYQPALGPVDFCFSAFNGADSYQAMAGLGWIIVGGESGPGARPFDVAWARSTVEQCRAARVACFVKQLGAQAFEQVNHRDGTWSKRPLRLRNAKGGDMSEWPAEIRVREMPEVRS